MPEISAHPHRKMASVLIVGGDSGRWIELDKALTLEPASGKFVGRVTAAGADLGKLDIIDGDNTSGNVYGFLHVTINANMKQTDIHARAANPSYDYAVGEKVYIVTDLTAQFLIKVEGSIAAVKPGMSYKLIVVDGEQRLDVANPGGPVVVTDEITESQRGFVRVKFNSAAVA